MLRFALVAALAVAGCKDKAATQAAKQDAGPRSTPEGSAESIDWAACEAAVAKAAGADLAARPAILLDGCKVCGDWTPIVRWNTPQEKGGPKRIDIEHAMLACNAFCLGDAKLKFLGTLDDARGKSSRMPWKQLALACRDQVSAVPDDRFIDGVYFALDRIARTVGAKGGEVATKLAALDLPLPPVSVVGTGPQLPAVATSSQITQLHITVLAGTIMVGRLPRARLTRDGVKVDMGGEPYPGKAVTVKALRAALEALAGTDKTLRVSLVAPQATPAASLVPIVAAASAVMPVFLAARASDSPEGWDLPASIPVELAGSGKAALRVTADMNVQQLAEALAKRAADGAKRVGLTGP